MSIEQALAETTAALNRNSDLLERVVAGQEAAIAKLEGATKTTRAPRAKKEDAPAAGESPAAEPADTGSGAESAGNASEPDAGPSGVAAIVASIGDSKEKIEAYAKAWLDECESGSDGRKERVELLKGIATKLGGTGFSGLLLDVKRAVFYIERAKTGAAVDLEAAYDFDGDPAQEVAAAATSDDEFG